MLSTNFTRFRTLYILLPIEPTCFVYRLITQFLSELLTQLTIINTSILQYNALLVVHLTNLDCTYRSYIVHSTIHMNVHNEEQLLKQFHELYNLFHIVNDKRKK